MAPASLGLGDASMSAAGEREEDRREEEEKRKEEGEAREEGKAPAKSPFKLRHVAIKQYLLNENTNKGE